MSEPVTVTIIGTIEFDPAKIDKRRVTKLFDEMVDEMLRTPRDTAWPDEAISDEHGSPGVGHFRAGAYVKKRKPKRKKR